MSWRFQKRITLLPGVRLNVGKTGTSVSFGGRGARFTVRPRGTTSTVGIPGTGLYWTETESRRRTHSAPPNTFQGFTFGQWVCLVWFLAVALLFWWGG